jgi:hypothetical protein
LEAEKRIKGYEGIRDKKGIIWKGMKKIKISTFKRNFPFSFQENYLT